jgi:hypothetical protein
LQSAVPLASPQGTQSAEPQPVKGSFSAVHRLAQTLVPKGQGIASRIAVSGEVRRSGDSAPS